VNAARILRWEMQAGTQAKRFNERVWLVDSMFLDMLSFEYIQGKTHGEALSDLNSIIVTASVTKKHFGEDRCCGHSTGDGQPPCRKNSQVQSGGFAPSRIRTFLRRCLTPFLSLDILLSI
jgi:hypothetical protein